MRTFTTFCQWPIGFTHWLLQKFWEAWVERWRLDRNSRAGNQSMVEKVDTDVDAGNKNYPTYVGSTKSVWWRLIHRSSWTRMKRPAVHRLRFRSHAIATKLSIKFFDFKVIYLSVLVSRISIYTWFAFLWLYFMACFLRCTWHGVYGFLTSLIWREFSLTYEMLWNKLLVVQRFQNLCKIYAITEHKVERQRCKHLLLELVSFSKIIGAKFSKCNMLHVDIENS